VSNNLASYYKKDDILRNKIANTNKLFKMARGQRSKALSTLERGAPSQEAPSSLFPTQVPK
jgi:hypothetical protein